MRSRQCAPLLRAGPLAVVESASAGRPPAGENAKQPVSTSLPLRRPILLSQLLLVGFLTLAISLHPGFVFKGNEGGISNYGIHLSTAIPYTLAFILGAFYSLKAARMRSLPRFVRIGLLVYAVLLLMTLFSTYVYKFNHGLKLIHVGTGVVLISFEVVASAWSYLRFGSGVTAGLFAVVIVGFIVAGLTFLGVAHLLFIGEALTTLGFAGLLIRTESALQGDSARALRDT